MDAMPAQARQYCRARKAILRLRARSIVRAGTGCSRCWCCGGTLAGGVWVMMWAGCPSPRPARAPPVVDSRESYCLSYCTEYGPAGHYTHTATLAPRAPPRARPDILLRPPPSPRSVPLSSSAPRISRLPDASCTPNRPPSPLPPLRPPALLSQMPRSTMWLQMPPSPMTCAPHDLPLCSRTTLSAARPSRLPRPRRSDRPSQGPFLAPSTSADSPARPSPPAPRPLAPRAPSVLSYCSQRRAARPAARRRCRPRRAPRSATRRTL